jgi:hypothetical protein
MAQLKVMGFAEPVIGPATSGRTRWLNASYGLFNLYRDAIPPHHRKHYIRYMSSRPYRHCYIRHAALTAAY